MAHDDDPNAEIVETDDWLVPAILVGVVVVLAVVVGVVVGVRSNAGDDESVAGQLEQWSSCLRSQGANVPLVESLRDGGFRVTVDGSFVESGIDADALRPALEVCEEDAPEALRRFMDLVDGFAEFPFGGFGADAFEFDDALGSNGSNRR